MLHDASPMSARRILVSHPWGIVLRKAIVILEPPKYWRRRPINGKESILKTKIQAYKGFQVLSGLNCVIARATAAVLGPRSFWYTTPSWFTMKVMTPELPQLAG
jgi:hypothetical protein